MPEVPRYPTVPPAEGGKGKPKRVRDKVSISWPLEERQLWEDFLNVARRDGLSASEWIRAWVRQYLTDHPRGNPQKPLEAFPGDKALSCEHDWVLDRRHYNVPVFLCRKGCGAWQALRQ